MLRSNKNDNFDNYYGNLPFVLVEGKFEIYNKMEYDYILIDKLQFWVNLFNYFVRVKYDPSQFMPPFYIIRTGLKDSNYLKFQKNFDNENYKVMYNQDKSAILK